MARNRRELVARNVYEWLRMTRNGSERLGTARNSYELSGIARNGWEGLGIARFFNYDECQDSSSESNQWGVRNVSLHPL